MEVEKERTVTYAQTVCTVRPEKDKPNRTRITTGGNLLEYPGKTTTDTAGLELIKIHWQLVLSTENAKYMTIDIGNFYTNTPMDRYEYMRMHISEIPDEIIDKYDMKNKVAEDGYIYLRIKKAIYGLKQSGALANKMLSKILNKEWYYQAKHTKGLWLHKTKNISFTLVVDDFGVNTYINKM